MTLHETPPFQGGAAGLFSYDLGRSLERLPPPRADEFRVPTLAVGFYDVVAAFDHVADLAWIISRGLPSQCRQIVWPTSLLGTLSLHQKAKQ